MKIVGEGRTGDICICKLQEREQCECCNVKERTTIASVILGHRAFDNGFEECRLWGTIGTAIVAERLHNEKGTTKRTQRKNNIGRTY